jgi:hypothetical protein
VFLLAGEIGAWLLGYRPWNPSPAEIVVEPGRRFFRADQSLGYTHLPGKFKVTINGSYVFHATNLDTTLRITHPVSSNNTQDAKKEVGSSATPLRTGGLSAMKNHTRGSYNKAYQTTK